MYKSSKKYVQVSKNVICTTFFSEKYVQLWPFMYNLRKYVQHCLRPPFKIVVCVIQYFRFGMVGIISSNNKRLSTVIAKIISSIAMIVIGSKSPFDHSFLSIEAPTFLVVSIFVRKTQQHNWCLLQCKDATWTKPKIVDKIIYSGQRAVFDPTYLFWFDFSSKNIKLIFVSDRAGLENISILSISEQCIWILTWSISSVLSLLWQPWFV